MSASIVPGEVTSRVINQFRELISLYGYEVLDLPVLEAADLFLVKAGDQVINQLFTFERNGQQLALRPEFTAAAAYHYRQLHAYENPVVRWQFVGPVFIDEADNALKEQLSLGAELIGMAGPVADAEIMGMAVAGLRRVGLNNLRLTLGHTGLVRRLLARFNLDSRTTRFLLHHLSRLKDEGKVAVLGSLDQLLLGRAVSEGEADAVWSAVNTQQMLDVLLDTTQRGITMGGRTRQDIAQRLLQKRQRFAERHQIIPALDLLEDLLHISGSPSTALPAIRALLLPLNDAAINAIITDWEETIALLRAYGIPDDMITVAPHLARGWEYYTGMVFELWSGGAHLGGGGRYDELVRLLGGGDDVPAVGFAYYMDELLEQISDVSSTPAMRLLHTGNPGAAVDWAQALRNRGLAVRMMMVGQPAELEVSGDGSISFQGKTYSRGQVDALITELQRGTP
jgi:histidyl-tRNA synthetase